MKKFFSIFLLLAFISQSANAKFLNSETGEELKASINGVKVCVAKVKKDGELELLTKFAIKKPELRKAMRSTTYFNRSLIFIGTTTVLTMLGMIAVGPDAFKAKMANPNINLAIGFASAAIDGAITSSYDDHSHFAYNFISFGVTNILRFHVPGLGERIMRGVRIDNLISPDAHEINEKRFNKIIDIIPTLETTFTRCDLDLFEK
ncbi:MAG: hypothetical protein AB8G05_06055 [Oligoflexales bacterium]